MSLVIDLIAILQHRSTGTIITMNSITL